MSHSVALLYPFAVSSLADLPCQGPSLSSFLGKPHIMTKRPKIVAKSVGLQGSESASSLMTPHQICVERTSL